MQQGYRHKIRTNMRYNFSQLKALVLHYYGIINIKLAAIRFNTL